MSKWIVDIHGEIEGDYEIIEEYEEPKTGHWIDTDEGIWVSAGGFNLPIVKCSCCSKDSLEEGAFCPNCGRRMENAESENKE